MLGASGYTGADLVRLAARHPDIEIAALTAKSHAGKPLAEVFPHLASLGPADARHERRGRLGRVDAVFCGLPHGTAQEEIAKLPRARSRSSTCRPISGCAIPQTYAEWYGGEHRRPELQKEAVYGLTEHYRDAIKRARLVACPGCYPTAVLLALLPLVEARLIEPSDIIIDAKSGVSGAGRTLKQNILFCEAGEGLSPYGIASHRHAPEIEQELGAGRGRAVTVNFTPHLMPMSRGELCTIYVRLAGKATADDLRAALAEAYDDEPFVRMVAEGRAARDATCARLELLPYRRLRRPHPGPRHRHLGASTIW